jgi:hypothetical protein
MANAGITELTNGFLKSFEGGQLLIVKGSGNVLLAEISKILVEEVFIKITVNWVAQGVNTLRPSSFTVVHQCSELEPNVLITFTIKLESNAAIEKDGVIEIWLNTSKPPKVQCSIIPPGNPAIAGKERISGLV